MASSTEDVGAEVFGVGAGVDVGVGASVGVGVGGLVVTGACAGAGVDVGVGDAITVGVGVTAGPIFPSRAKALK